MLADLLPAEPPSAYTSCFVKLIFAWPIIIACSATMRPASKGPSSAAAFRNKHQLMALLLLLPEAEGEWVGGRR